MKLRNQPPGGTRLGIRRAAPVGAFDGPPASGLPTSPIGSILLAGIGCGIGLLANWIRLSSDQFHTGRRAATVAATGALPRRGQPAKSSRRVKTIPQRILLARSSVSLAATTRRSRFTPGARGQVDSGSRLLAPGCGALETSGTERRRDIGPGTRHSSPNRSRPRLLGDLAEKLLYVEAVETENPENMRPHPWTRRRTQAAERLCRQPGWESRETCCSASFAATAAILTAQPLAFRRLLDHGQGGREPRRAGPNFAACSRTFLRVGAPPWRIRTPVVLCSESRARRPPGSW